MKKKPIIVDPRDLDRPAPKSSIAPDAKADETEAAQSAVDEAVQLVAENRELKRQLDALREIFHTARYPITSTPQLQRTLEDAFRLYDALTGRRKVGELLNDLWTAKVNFSGPYGSDAILPGMAEYLVPYVLRFLEVGPDDPLYGHLEKLPERLAAKAAERIKFVNAFRERIQKLAAENGLTDSQEIELHENAIGLMCLQHPDAIHAAGRGDWTAVDWFFRRQAQGQFSRLAN